MYYWKLTLRRVLPDTSLASYTQKTRYIYLPMGGSLETKSSTGAPILATL